jgi:hypothetical protein
MFHYRRASISKEEYKGSMLKQHNKDPNKLRKLFNCT